jgi:hypothetical protein
MRAVRPLGVGQDLGGNLAFSAERSAGGDLPARARVLKSGELARNPGQRRHLENFWKIHQGLSSDGGNWVNFQRHFGRDVQNDGFVEAGPGMGTSEAPMRNQMKDQAQYMDAGRAAR